MWLGCLTSQASLNELARARSSRAELTQYPPLPGTDAYLLVPSQADFPFIGSSTVEKHYMLEILLDHDSQAHVHILGSEFEHDILMAI